MVCNSANRWSETLFALWFLKKQWMQSLCLLGGIDQCGCRTSATDRPGWRRPAGWGRWGLLPTRTRLSVAASLVGEKAVSVWQTKEMLHCVIRFSSVSSLDWLCDGPVDAAVFYIYTRDNAGRALRLDERPLLSLSLRLFSLYPAAYLIRIYWLVARVKRWAGREREKQKTQRLLFFHQFMLIFRPSVWWVGHLWLLLPSTIQ